MNLMLAIAALVLALIPCVLFLWNLGLYVPLPMGQARRARCSILIPARNEEANIENALRSLLPSEGVDFEVVVLDDGSTDGTAAIASRLALEDARIRLEPALPLPPRWCGKNFACHQLAGLARHPILIFMDADVRVSRPDSISRLAHFMESTGVSLVSGVPRQVTGTLSERLIVPLIHFILLGFLPFTGMRRSSNPRFAAACGQILAVHVGAYAQAGGHASVSNRLHDAVALARRFREKGLKTDLFDATDTFHCRMYHRGREVWHGFAKNAQEGLAAPKLIVPATCVLFGGQVMPIVGWIATGSSPAISWVFAAASLAAWLPRLLGVARFRQPLIGALLHPIGVLLLLGIQWDAFIRSLRRQPSTWKGRVYQTNVSNW